MFKVHSFGGTLHLTPNTYHSVFMLPSTFFFQAGSPDIKYLIAYIDFLLVWFCNFIQFLIFFPRYQDGNTQAFFMVVSSNRWLSIRLDLLSSVFITVVAVAATLVSENPGQ